MLPQLPNYRLSTLVELETGQPLVGATSGTTVPQLEDEWFASLANDDAAIDPDTEHSQEEMLHLRSSAAEACLDALDRSIQRLAQVEEGAVRQAPCPLTPVRSRMEAAPQV